jgi:hypothetical protein
MKIIGAIMTLVSYALTFWAGGAFTLAVTIIDMKHGITPAELYLALTWPVGFVHWILR